MFKSKTLFIIGAGASCEAGLPSGHGLKAKIAELLDIRFSDRRGELESGSGQIVHALYKQMTDEAGGRGNINPHIHKARQIRDAIPSLALSIDNYLEAHRGDVELELVGKLGIVRAILDAEHDSKLRSIEEHTDEFDLSALDGSWYHTFFQMLNEGVNRADVERIFDNVSIITFNYDRCIERYLVQAMATYYRLDKAEACRIVNKLVILHPYGKVGDLPWQTDGVKTVPFGGDPYDLLDLTSQIRTFSEGEANQTLLMLIQQLVKDCGVLVFMGFAYHPMNMQLLTVPGRMPVKRIYATAMKLSESDIQVVTRAIRRLSLIPSGGIRDFGDSDPIFLNGPCSTFLNDYFRTITTGGG